jgi:Flp pilus assembly pilin Flp
MSMERAAQFIHDEDGQDVAEYGLLVAGVGLLVLASATSLGTSLHTWFAVIADQLNSYLGS